MEKAKKMCVVCGNREVEITYLSLPDGEIEMHGPTCGHTLCLKTYDEVMSEYPFVGGEEEKQDGLCA